MKLIHKVTARTYNDKGELVKSQIGHNTVTDGAPATIHNGFVWCLDRIFGDGTYYDPDDFINKMQLGTGTPSNSGLGTPLTAVPSTTLIAFSSPTPTFDISTLDAPVVTVTCDWDSTFDALTGVSEVGLFADNTDTVLIAHKTFSPALSKLTGGTIQISWEITLS